MSSHEFILCGLLPTQKANTCMNGLNTDTGFHTLIQRRNGRDNAANKCYILDKEQRNLSDEKMLHPFRMHFRCRLWPFLILTHYNE